MQTTYSATDDPNVFIKEDIRESIVSISEIESQIDDLNTEIQDLSLTKEKPDQETLDLWNEVHIDSVKKLALIEFRDQQIALVKQLREIKVK